jgi:hypothetical protein
MLQNSAEKKPPKPSVYAGCFPCGRPTDKSTGGAVLQSEKIGANLASCLMECQSAHTIYATLGVMFAILVERSWELI